MGEAAADLVGRFGVLSMLIIQSKWILLKRALDLLRLADGVVQAERRSEVGEWGPAELPATDCRHARESSSETKAAYWN